MILAALALLASAEPVEPQLLELLSYIDVPLDADRLQAVGARPTRLAEIASDHTLRPYVRMRATGGLAFFARTDETARAALFALARTGTHREVRIAALSALGTLAPQDVEAVLVASIAEETDDAVTEAALRATRRIGAERGTLVIDRTLARVPAEHPWRTSLTELRSSLRR